MLSCPGTGSYCTTTSRNAADGKHTGTGKCKGDGKEEKKKTHPIYIEKVIIK